MTAAVIFYLLGYLTALVARHASRHGLPGCAILLSGVSMALLVGFVWTLVLSL